MIGDAKFIALNREAELAKRVTCSGLTALRKATPGRPGIYYDAFFGLSIGLERLAKLVWLIDECIKRRGSFPTDRDLRKVGHDVLALLNKAKAIRSSRVCRQSPTAGSQLPSDAITGLVIKFLSDFGQGSRYFNIDLMVGGKSIAMGDPIAVWHKTVGAAVLATPKISAKQGQWRAQAAQVADAYSPSIVIASAADGSPVSDVAALWLRDREAEEINKQAQWKVLGIVRFVCLLLMDLSDDAHARSHSFIPDLTEHFGFFCGDDAIIRRYKTWPPAGIR